jgi:hypothetical protein
MIMVGLVWCGSRAGMVAGVCVLIAAVVIRVLSLRGLVRLVIWAVVLWVGVVLIENLIEWSQGGGRSLNVQGALSGDTSNHERWATWLYAIQLWRESPIWGAGLGVFLSKSVAWLSHPQVVHSTPLWILAEFGLVGLVIMIWAIYKLVTYVGRGSMSLSPHRTALFLHLLGFLVFCLFHEIFYQRIFWLVLGAVMAVPASQQRN